jgi:hypothetical protein
MPLEAFHVSTEVYEVGQVVAVPTGQQTRFQGRLAAGNATQAEVRLEAGRPAGAQSRLTTQYAFADVYDCQNYGNSQYPDQELHFYRVSIEDPTRVPMAMVDIIKNVQGATAAQITALVNAYWNPTVPWQVYEYLAGAMTILEKLLAPADGLALIAANYRMGQSIIRAGLVRDAILAGQPIPAFPDPEAEDEDEAEEAAHEAG